VPRQKEDRHLIDHLGRLEPLARHRVGGGHDLGGQIVGRGACRDLRRRSSVSPAISARMIAGRWQRARPVQARHPARQGQEGRKVQDGLRALIGAEFVKDGRATASSIGMENSVRKITSAAAWLASSSTSTTPGASRATAACPAGQHGGKGVAQAARLRRPGR
jgi:hypothetical protein